MIVAPLRLDVSRLRRAGALLSGGMGLRVVAFRQGFRRFGGTIVKIL